MTRIIMANRILMPLPLLKRAVTKYIHDPENMGYQEIVDMKNAIVHWNEYIQSKKQENLNRFGPSSNDFLPLDKQGTELSEQELQLQYLAKLYKDNEEGLLDERKNFFKRHKIDYRKAYGFQEAFAPGDFAKAQEALKVAMANDKENYEI